jgi:hypothetical protein
MASGKPLLLGINSKGDIKEENYSTRTDLPESQKFFQEMAAKHSIDICGVNKNCGGGTPPPTSAPTCSIALNATAIKVGQSLLATLTTQGEVTSATLNGTAVSFPTGTLTLTGITGGIYSVLGVALGPAGQGTCQASYEVEGPGPLPIADFTIIPLYCGMNSVLETPVREVCISTLKFSHYRQSVTVKDLILIQFSDASYEVLPVLHRKIKAQKPDDITIREEWVAYANKLKKATEDLLLDTRSLTLSTLPEQELPLSLDGRSSNGHYFLINQFTKPKSRVFP